MMMATEVQISRKWHFGWYFFFPPCPNAMERSAVAELPESIRKKRGLLGNRELTVVKVVRLAAATVGQKARLGHTLAGNPPNPPIRLFCIADALLSKVKCSSFSIIRVGEAFPARIFHVC